MLRRLVTKKPLLIVPVVLALVLAGLFLPVREVSIESYGVLSLESKITDASGTATFTASEIAEWRTAEGDPTIHKAVPVVDRDTATVTVTATPFLAQSP